MEHNYVKTIREYSITALRKLTLLKDLLLKVKSGMTGTKIVCFLIGDDSETEEASEYINQLIDFQFLANELARQIRGNDEWERVFAIFNITQALKEHCEHLKRIKKQFLELDATLIPANSSDIDHPIPI